MTAQIRLYPEASGGRRRVEVYPYMPQGKPQALVIVCPGGSYSWLGMEDEGHAVGRWLSRNGIAALVLRYRVANVSAYVLGYRVLGVGNRYPDMLEDVEAALRYAYIHADSMGVDTARIGVMGFSAGGHLAMLSAIYNDTPFRPKFLVPVYPVVTMADKAAHRRSRRGALGVWGQFDITMRDSLSVERHLDASCPPVLLIHCADDKVVHPRNAFLLDSALTAGQIPHRTITYRTGNHGFGAAQDKGTEESQQWKQAFIQWISNLNL